MAGALDYKIIEQLLDGPLTTDELCKRLGPIGTQEDWNPKRAHERLMLLEKQGKVEHFDETWRLPRVIAGSEQDWLPA
jgi:hypothetical protein